MQIIWEAISGRVCNEIKVLDAEQTGENFLMMSEGNVIWIKFG